MPFNELEKARIDRIVGGFCEGRISMHLRNQIKIFYRVRGYEVKIIESRPTMTNSHLWAETPIALVTIEAAAKKLSGQIKTVKPGEEHTVKGIAIKTVPAYNLTKFRSPGVPFHPKDAGHVGYLITVKGLTIYHTGDSDFIPEMKGLKPDVALLPVSGTYVMTAEEAAEAAAAIQPKVAIPMHVGEGIGSLADAERFREKAAVPVVVKPIEK